MPHSEIVINENYGGLNPVQYGRETCESLHSYGPAVRTHWLLHYVKSGKGVFVREGETFLVNKGEIFVIPPYKETFYQADEHDPWDYIWIGFTVNGAAPECFSKAVLHVPEAEGIFEEMRRCKEYEGGRSAFLTSCLWKLVGFLLESETKKPDYVDKALSFIHAEYSNPINVQTIADGLNLDRSYFSTLFTQKVGMPPRDYLRAYRLNRAAELMVRYGERPSTAALSVGYEDLFHFSKSFKQFFGLSPRAYVKEKRE